MTQDPGPGERAVATSRPAAGEPDARANGRAAADTSSLAARYGAVRSRTLGLTVGLSAEDCALQSMPDASPTKWHLAHTTWFFETFVLAPAGASRAPTDPAYATLFNSYYHVVGPQWPRARRGLLSRPSLSEVLRYRRQVDEDVVRLVDSDRLPTNVADAVVLGLQHEQQHQELILTDLKHLFSVNPLRPVYRVASEDPPSAVRPLGWVSHPGGICEIGHDGPGFAFDNEGPRHRVLLEPFDLADRLVTCGEYREFMDDGGYRRPELWLADGWTAVLSQGWTAPLYWESLASDTPSQFTLAGLRRVLPAEPVCHVSFYEADAYARWAGARLPTEAEWEGVAAAQPIEGTFADEGRLHPAPGGEPAPGRASQIFGDVWEWTASPYVPYPGYRPWAGAIGEYNGKFMCDQHVVRGGSCATPRDHVRATYRNFFPASSRWQFTGIRLAR